MSMIPHPFVEGRSLKEFCTFGIGGPARYFVEISTIEEVQEALSYCKQYQIPYFVLGKGSNTLFDDRGFNGLVILNRINFCEEEKGQFHVGAGYSFSLLGIQTARRGWEGLEFASGIPGSVGGAVYMNAGASGSEVKDVLAEVVFIAESGEVMRCQRGDLEFCYRLSSFQRMRGVIASARFVLKPSSEARKKQLTMMARRTKTQPYGEKSAGCVFRNPPSISAGALIESCGLKGRSVGGAEVAELHGNFILNTKGASSKDVLLLIEQVKESVLQKKGVALETEIRYVPYE